MLVLKILGSSAFNRSEQIPRSNGTVRRFLGQIGNNGSPIYAAAGLPSGMKIELIASLEPATHCAAAEPSASFSSNSTIKVNHTAFEKSLKTTKRSRRLLTVTSITAFASAVSLSIISAIPFGLAAGLLILGMGLIARQAYLWSAKQDLLKSVSGAKGVQQLASYLAGLDDSQREEAYNRTAKVLPADISDSLRTHYEGYIRILAFLNEHENVPLQKIGISGCARLKTESRPLIDFLLQTRSPSSPLIERFREFCQKISRYLVDELGITAARQFLEQNRSQLGQISLAAAQELKGKADNFLARIQPMVKLVSEADETIRDLTDFSAQLQTIIQRHIITAKANQEKKAQLAETERQAQIMSERLRRQEAEAEEFITGKNNWNSIWGEKPVEFATAKTILDGIGQRLVLVPPACAESLERARDSLNTKLQKQAHEAETFIDTLSGGGVAGVLEYNKFLSKIESELYPKVLEILKFIDPESRIGKHFLKLKKDYAEIIEKRQNKLARIKNIHELEGYLVGKVMLRELSFEALEGGGIEAVQEAEYMGLGLINLIPLCTHWDKWDDLVAAYTLVEALHKGSEDNRVRMIFIKAEQILFALTRYHHAKDSSQHRPLGDRVQIGPSELERAFIELLSYYRDSIDFDKIKLE